MQRFFTDFDAIDAFTLSLDYHQDKIECCHCSRNGQLVSHGIISKQRSIKVSEPVGKRVFCSNRYGRTGCGRTFQLYVASELPSFQYGAAPLVLFISLLLAHFTVSEAYQKATGQWDTRNAWRWINKLIRKLGDYRCFLNTRTQSAANTFSSRVRRYQILLPTLAQLTAYDNGACSSYQLITQYPFI